MRHWPRRSLVSDDTAMIRWQSRQQKSEDGRIEKKEAIDYLDRLFGICSWLHVTAAASDQMGDKVPERLLRPNSS